MLSPFSDQRLLVATSLNGGAIWVTTHHASQLTNTELDRDWVLLMADGLTKVLGGCTLYSLFRLHFSWNRQHIRLRALLDWEMSHGLGLYLLRTAVFLNYDLGRLILLLVSATQLVVLWRRALDRRVLLGRRSFLHDLRLFCIGTGVVRLLLTQFVLLTDFESSRVLFGSARLGERTRHPHLSALVGTLVRQEAVRQDLTHYLVGSRGTFAVI